MAKKAVSNSLENYLQELEEILSQISDSSVPLETSLKLYQKGISLYEKCYQELETYKEKIYVLQNAKEVVEDNIKPNLEKITQEELS